MSTWGSLGQICRPSDNPFLDSTHVGSVAMTEIALVARQRTNARGGHRARYHCFVLAAACAVWAIAFLLHELPDGQVAIRGFPQFPLPQACASRVLFGFRCPGCGLTRSIIHIAEADWRASWHDHRLGGLIALVIAFQIPYRLYALCRPGQELFSTFWLSMLGYALAAMLIVNWLVDLATGRISSP